MSSRLAVDRIRCDGRGVCADLLPELIQLDDWGYPMVAPDAVAGHLLPLARLAVSSCPVMALRLAAVGGRTAAGQLPADSKAQHRAL